MMAIRRLLCVAVAIGFLMGGASEAVADEQSDAVDKARVIVRLMNEKKFSLVWDDYVSPYFKAVTVKDQFVANMTIGRAQLGPLSNSQHISTEFATQEPNFNYQGKLYAIMFLNTYGAGKLYERIVVIRDQDGQLRLGGIFGAPVPN